ncbi:MAG: DUF2007 domain-containing protein [Candidatus Hinthialibacter antarcticus]|nr:DUF2007 domain-containing protein [Candidatus Hinthialibacter antarcticus]
MKNFLKTFLTFFTFSGALHPVSSEAINSDAEAQAESSDDIVEVARYTMLQDADFARMTLQSEGIEAVIMDDAVSAWAPHYTFASGIRLFVQNADAARAVRVLKAPGAAIQS